MARRKRPSTALARISRTARRYPLLTASGVLGALLLLWRLRRPAVPTRFLTTAEQIQNFTRGKVFVINNPSAEIAGSDTTAQALALSDPPKALADLDALDRQWSPAVEGYRAKHNFLSRLVSVMGAPSWWVGNRYPTRWIVIRLTVESLMYGQDSLAQHYGPQYAFTDPTTGKPTPAWVALLTTYSPTQGDLEGIAADVRRANAGPESSGMFDALIGGLRTLVGGTAAAVTGQWGALAKTVGGLFAGGSGGPADLAVRPLSRDEQAMLAHLQSVRVIALVDSPTTDAPRPLSAQEALSGGGTPVAVGLAALGGVEAFAAELRGLAISPEAKALSNEALCLKAALLARRVPLSNVNPSSLPALTREDTL